MIDDFDDGLSDDEQADALREMNLVLEDQMIADYDVNQMLWDHSQGIGF